MSVVAGRVGNVPVILGEETSDPMQRRWKGHLLYRMLSAATDHMVTASPAVQHYLTGRLGLAEHKVSMINNGVDEPAPAAPGEIADIRRHFDLRDEDIVIGSVGPLLDKCKRVSDLITAMVLLKPQHSRIHLLVVGSGPDEAMLRHLAKSLGVQDFVHFAGYQRETRAFLEVMDIFALASTTEAFGLVLVEAMFAGLPVVASRVSGVLGIVEHKDTGLLVSPFQPVELAMALGKLINNPMLRKAMGQKGLLRARAHFTANRYASETDRLYSRLLRANAAASNGFGCQRG